MSARRSSICHILTDYIVEQGYSPDQENALQSFGISFEHCEKLDDFCSAVRELSNSVEILIVACFENLLDGLNDSDTKLRINAMRKELHQKAMQKDGALRIHIVPYLPFEDESSFKSDELMDQLHRISWFPTHISLLSLQMWVALGVDLDLKYGVDQDFSKRFTTGLIQIAMVLVGSHRLNITGQLALP